ncbi:uncharacterized protein LOC114406713 [Glycine soja]|nr:uncharacterized protein LOC114406713 [Glycine soja]
MAFFDDCKKNVSVALIDMHSCSLEAKIKMNLDAQVVEQVAEVKKPERKKPKSKEPMVKKAKVEKGKKVKDPNMPMRPPTTFFAFLLMRTSFLAGVDNCYSYSQYPYYPGQRVKVNTSTASKPARWLGGTWKDNHDEGALLRDKQLDENLSDHNLHFVESPALAPPEVQIDFAAQQQ